MKNLTLLITALLSLNVYAFEEALSIVDVFVNESDSVKEVQVSYNLPCGVLKSEIKEVKIYSEEDRIFYLGLTIPTNSKHRKVFCNERFTVNQFEFRFKSKHVNEIKIIK